MSDAGFVAAAYGAILGGLALYAVTLWRRLSAARDSRSRTGEDEAE